MSTGTAPLSAPAGPGLSQVERVVDTFIAPSKTFQDIRRSTSWWLPWILISIFAIAFLVTIDKKIGWEQVVRTQITKNARASAQMDRLPPDQRERAIQMQAKMGKYIAYANPLLMLLIFVIIAAVLLATFNFGLGAEMKFGAVLAVVIYASLPGIVSALLGIVSLLAGINPEGFNAQNPVASNLAYFMDPNGSKFLYGMASAVDIFVIWTLVLLGIGFSSNSKVRRGTCLAVVIIWYLVYKLGASGLAAAFS